MRRTAPLKNWNLNAKGEFSCRVCGHVATDLHHAIPRSLCSPEAKTDLRNGLPLCHACHEGWHRKTVTIPGSVFTYDEWAYLISVTMLGRVTWSWLEDHYPLRAAA